jgi:hypothetical protein
MNRISNFLSDSTQEVHDLLGFAQLRLMDLDPWQMTPELFHALASDLLNDYEKTSPFWQRTIFAQVLLEQYCWVFSETCKRN